MKLSILILVINLICLAAFSLFSQADEGVYVSNGQSSQQYISPQQEKVVQQIVFNSILKSVSETLERAILRRQLQLVPQMSYMAANQIAIQTFKHPHTRDIVRDAFQDGLDELKWHQENQSPKATFQRALQTKIDQSLNPLYNDPVFRQIVDAIVQQAMVNQQQMVLQQAFQQRAQQAQEMARQQQETQEQLKKAFDAAMKGVLIGY